MKEILGGELELAFKGLGINAVKKYESQDKEYQVWELSDNEFEKLDNISEEDWKDEYGWFRYAVGSNKGNIEVRYNINNHYIKAWDSNYRKEMIEENKTLKPEDRYWENRKYNNLFEYFCNEIGASQPRNVCALAVDLAKQNGMTMAELFIKYQG